MLRPLVHKRCYGFLTRAIKNVRIGLYWSLETYTLEEHMASFEELKSKYQSVLQVIQQQQVSVKNLHMQDGKLFIKGAAPSLEAANKVWDEIKRVNPRADDITADFPVDPSLQQQTGSGIRTYKV